MFLLVWALIRTKILVGGNVKQVPNRERNYETFSETRASLWNWAYFEGSY